MRSSLGILVVAACGGSPSPLDDGGTLSDGDVPVDGTVAAGTVLYPSDRTLSPLTADLVANLRAVHATSAGSDAVFAKIGDSHTVSTSYLACFAGTNVDLDSRDLASTVAHFKAGDAAGTTPYQRVSLAATVGWSAGAVLTGSPTRLQQEVDAVDPAFATVMFGSNDIGGNRIDLYGQNMATIVDTLLAQGIIPIMSTIPPRDDSATADRMVPRYNAVVRAIAQTRGIPLVDLHRELVPLPAHGLASDGIHLQTGGGGACNLDAAGLMFGNNVRNLHVLATLDRLRRTVVESEPAPDAEAPRLRGTGAPADPFVIDVLPFGDRRDTATFGTREIASYPACSPADESGNEVYYRIEVTAATTLRAYVIDHAADIDLQVLRDAPTATGCISRHDTAVDVAVEPGTYYVVADTYQDNAGPYTLVVTTD
ncbi:MAG: SGNH/GDSL hydrolase family protein [Kofleriaceae bacterium]|nr:SGNH/GDSL hydrolase family protein [Kofleriaceae bacterium]